MQSKLNCNPQWMGLLFLVVPFDSWRGLPCSWPRPGCCLRDRFGRGTVPLAVPQWREAYGRAVSVMCVLFFEDSIHLLADVRTVVTSADDGASGVK